jgi:hypothetical protein
MNRARGFPCIGLLLFFVILPSVLYASKTRVIDVRPVADGEKTRVFIQTTMAEEARVVAVRKALIRGGAERVNLFMPSLIVCEVPAGSDVGKLIDDPAFFYVQESLTPGPQRVVAMTDEMSFARECYEIAVLLNSGKLPELDPSQFHDEVYEIPPEVVELSRQRFMTSAALDSHRTVQQTAEFMIGDMVVQPVFPESDGSDENWTNKELRDANQAVASGMLAFQQRFNYAPMHFIFSPVERVQTTYEPIHHNSGTDFMWISDVMKELVDPNIQDAAYAAYVYNEAARKRFGADWAYTSFIADSRNEPGNRFRGAGYTAYAMLGGPYLVQPFPAGNNDPNDLGEILLFSQIFQHETVHIFWGLDEYPSAPSQCSSISGYLAYTNSNKQSLLPDGKIAGCPTYVPCLMWGARNREDRPICRWTAGQIGVIDTQPENGIPDVFDMPPTVEFENSHVETVQTSAVTIKFKAISQGVRNRNPVQDPSERITYAAPLKDAMFSVNGVGSARLEPLDGDWDEVEEDVSLTLSGLSAGLTEIQVRVRNSFGRSSQELVKEIYFIGLQFALFDLQPRVVGPGENAVDIAWKTIGHTFGAVLSLYRIDYETGAPVTTLLASWTETPDPDELFHPYSHRDENVEAGHTYEYYVEGRFTLTIDGEDTEFVSTSNTFEVGVMLATKPGDIVSLATPNPFTKSTSFSISVPDAGGAQTTAVQVEIFDVAGRRVKEVFSGDLLGRVRLFDWDGTNDNGQPVPSGVYFLRANAADITEVKKVVLVR